MTSIQVGNRSDSPAIVAGLLAFPAPSAQAAYLAITGEGMQATSETYGCPTSGGTCSLAARD